MILHFITYYFKSVVFYSFVNFCELIPIADFDKINSGPHRVSNIAQSTTLDFLNEKCLGQK